MPHLFQDLFPEPLVRSSPYHIRVPRECWCFSHDPTADLALGFLLHPYYPSLGVIKDPKPLLPLRVLWPRNCLPCCLVVSPRYESPLHESPFPSGVPLSSSHSGWWLLSSCFWKVLCGSDSLPGQTYQSTIQIRLRVCNYPPVVISFFLSGTQVSHTHYNDYWKRKRRQRGQWQFCCSSVGDWMFIWLWHKKIILF